MKKNKKKDTLINLFYGNKLKNFTKHKTYKFLGIKINIRKYKPVERLELLLLQIHKKLSMTDNQCRIDNTKFYVPNYPFDLIQSWVVDNGEFFENDLLEYLKKYIPQNAIILDIGANIGNHSLYWANECGAKKIYSFEPIKETFDILKKNVEINNLDNAIIPFNFGLSDENCSGQLINFYQANIGATQIKKSNKKFETELKILDTMDIQEDKIDFIKIDVEAHEYYTLKGMKNTLEKYKPTIFIEIFPDNYEKVKALLESYNYQETEKFEYNNYIFEYKKN